MQTTENGVAAVLADTASELRNVVLETSSRLTRVTDSEASQSPSTGKWCAKEVIGHLVDSAANNHHRFVRALQQKAMTFPAYDADHWVNSQAYGDEKWEHLLLLWTSYNLHLSHVIERIPAEALDHVCSMGNDEPSVLRDLVVDYLGHLKHHLEQVDEVLQVRKAARNHSG